MDQSKEVQILTKNCIDSDSAITSSHSGSTDYLWDRDNDSKWKSVGANRDDVSAVLQIIFKIGSVETEFRFNRIMILNTNVKDFVLEWWEETDSTWHSVVDAGISANAGYVCFTFGTIKSSRIRLTLKNTQSHNKEKEIGELIITRIRYVLDTGFTNYEFSFVDKSSPYPLGDGGLHIAHVRSPGNRTTRYTARCVFTLLSRNDFEKLRCLKDEGEAFLWYPEAISRPDEVWLVHWVSPLSASYTTTFVGAGYSLMMELAEA